MITNKNTLEWTSNISISDFIPAYWKKYIINDDINKVNMAIHNSVLAGDQVLPEPSKLFRALNLVKLDNIKVVVIGQDPYYTTIYSKELKQMIPYAEGLSFSIPPSIKKVKEFPPSLVNIFSNMKKYNHIQSYPSIGDLSKWSEQGVLLLNRTLTVVKNSPNSSEHVLAWDNVTKEIIKHISNKKGGVVFVLWGSNALELLNLIDINKHKIHISSHPSPRSYNKPLGNYPAFNSVDHFTIINSYLDDKINWKI